MRLGYHLGKCCGIKTIWGLGCSPDYVAEPLHVHSENANWPDKCGHDVSSDVPFFRDAAPEETYKDRLKRYIDYCDDIRPNGIIEIVLADGTGMQIASWRNIIEKHGFKEVNRCKNSNSGNTIYVFHKNSGE